MHEIGQKSTLKKSLFYMWPVKKIQAKERCFPKNSGLPLFSRCRNYFIPFFKTKVLLGIYQEDFFLILETFLSWEEMGEGLSSSSGDFCWTSFKPCSFQQNLLNFKTQKMPKPTKDFVVKWEENSFEMRGWLTATAFLLLFNDKPLLFTYLQHFHIYNMGS